MTTLTAPIEVRGTRQQYWLNALLDQEVGLAPAGRLGPVKNRRQFRRFAERLAEAGWVVVLRPLGPSGRAAYRAVPVEAAGPADRHLSWLRDCHGRALGLPAAVARAATQQLGSEQQALEALLQLDDHTLQVLAGLLEGSPSEGSQCPLRDLVAAARAATT